MPNTIIVQASSLQTQQFKEIDLHDYATKTQQTVDAALDNQQKIKPYKLKILFYFTQSTLDKLKRPFSEDSAEVFIDCFYDTPANDLTNNGYWLKCRSWVDSTRFGQHVWTCKLAKRIGLCVVYNDVQEVFETLEKQFPKLRSKLYPLKSMRVFRYNVPINPNANLHFETYTFDNFQTFHSLGSLVFSDPQQVENVKLHDISLPVRSKIVQALVSSEPEAYAKMTNQLSEKGIHFFSEPIAHNFFGESREDHK